jgi:methyl-accepting chemotaxis protein
MAKVVKVVKVMSMLKDMRVSYKLSSMVIVGIIGFITLLLVSESALKRNMIHEKEMQLTAVIQSVISQITHLNSTLPKEEAQRTAKELLESVQFHGDNYLFVMNSSRTILAHPRRKDLIGKQMGNPDVNSPDHFWFQFTEVASQGGGTVTYPWDDGKGNPVQKISYVDIFKPWGWIIGSGLLTDDIDREISSQYIHMGMITLAIVLVMVILGYIISRSVIVPLDAIKNAMNKVAEGDLTAVTTVYGKDEIGSVASHINQSMNSIREALLESVNSSKELSDAATRIASSAEETSHAVASQRDQLNQLATAMNQMSATVSDVAGHAESTAHDTVDATKEADKGSDDVMSSTNSIKSLVSELDLATEQVNKLKEGVMEISEVTSVISGISEQTNLLALNAAIEAARAGDQGRGFAVVADEVRNLAGRTSQSTEEIQATINSLQSLSVGTADAMKRSQDLAYDSVSRAESCGSDLNMIVEHIRHVSDKTTQIATAAEEQSAVAEEMNRNVSGINDSALEMSQAANHLASESESLADMSRILDKKLTKFTL